MNSIIAYFAAFGRIVLGAIFFGVAVGEFFLDRPGAAIELLTDRGAPMPTAFYSAIMSIFAVGGLAMIVGFGMRMAALLISVSIVAIDLIMFDFWASPSSDPIDPTFVLLFVMNIAIACGLLAFLGLGGGPLALDNLMGKKNSGTPAA